jgi:hypothetical protein
MEDVKGKQTQSKITCHAELKADSGFPFYRQKQNEFPSKCQKKKAQFVGLAPSRRNRYIVSLIVVGGVGLPSSILVIWTGWED